MARRHLPVVNPTPARAAPPTDAATTAPEEPHPWHWIPLGTVVSVLAFALLAPGVPWLLRVFVGPRPASSAVAALAGGLSLAAMLLAVAAGGAVVGRFGPAPQTRHGALSAVCTTLLLWAVTQRPWFLLCLLPLSLAVGWASAWWGQRRVGLFPTPGDRGGTR
jgi:hypothetical protein